MPTVARTADGVGSLQAGALAAAYAAGDLIPLDVAGAVIARVAARGEDAVWITRVPDHDVRAAARALQERWAEGQRPPLYGLPFAVKGNIDVAGLPTTAGCPAYAYQPDATATLVQRLLDAGALLVGTTNLDQFATGLSGARSPYGSVVAPADPHRIAGGSSSGSAVAVAAGLVSFAIGTDTAGSGRVPASFTGTVGVKPSRGLVSTRGVVPACRSLDCPSVFTLSVADGAAVLSVLAGYDEADPFSRKLGPVAPVPAPLDLSRLRVGVPAGLHLEDDEARTAWQVALDRLAGLGATSVPVDLIPFEAAGRLLYQGSWLAERWAAVGGFVAAHPDHVHPVVARVLDGGAQITAVEAFRDAERLAVLRRTTEATWSAVDVLLLPTTPTHPALAAVEADPIGLNAQLGRWTTFANLLDLAAVAVPSALTPTGVPVGVSLLAPAGSDDLLLSVAAAWERAVGLPAGATGCPLLTPPPARAAAPAPPGTGVLLTVVGAHMSGLPLNNALVTVGGRLHASTPTAPSYRLMALPGGPPRRPGLVRVTSGGASVEAETWEVPQAALSDLLVAVPAPLAIGTVELADGTTTLGFICEAAGAHGAQDITAHGGWQAYLASRR